MCPWPFTSTFLSVLVENSTHFCDLCRSANVAVSEDASPVLRPAVQDLNTKAECDFAVAAKAVALKRVSIFEESAPLSLAFGLSRRLIWMLNATSRTLQRDVSTPICWQSANKSLAKQLCMLNFVVLKMHLLDSRLGGNWILSTSRLLSFISRTLLERNGWWTRPSWPTRIFTRRLLSLHCLTLGTRSWIRALCRRYTTVP